MPLHAHRATGTQAPRPVFALRLNAVSPGQRNRQVGLGKGQLLQAQMPERPDVARAALPEVQIKSRITRGYALQGQIVAQLVGPANWSSPEAKAVIAALRAE